MARRRAEQRIHNAVQRLHHLLERVRLDDRLQQLHQILHVKDGGQRFEQFLAA